MNAERAARAHSAEGGRDPMPNAVIYARVSSKEQAAEGFSIPAQLRVLREYASKQGLAVVREFVEAETAKCAGRAEFRAMVDFLRARHKTCRVLLVEKTDRLHRNLRDWVTIDELVEELGVEVHLVKEGGVLAKESRSSEKLMHGIRAVLAKNYIDNLGEEASKGMLQKAEQGTWPSQAPFGYLNVSVGEKRTIEFDPERAGLLRNVFEWYAEGYRSLDEVTQVAAGEGLTTRRGQPPTKSTIERVLKNPFYIGQFRWKGRVFRGDHPPLVSVELFQRVQHAFRHANHPGHQERRTFAYTGLIKCARCGCAITAELHKGKYTYYHCTRRRGPCDVRAVREERLEELLGEVVQRIQIDDQTIEWVIRSLRDSHRDEAAYHDEQVTKLQAQVRGLQVRVDRLYEDRLDRKVPEDLWRRKTDESYARQMELTEALERHQRANHVYFEEGERLLRLAQKAYNLWLSQGREERRELLTALGSNYTWDGENLAVSMRKPFCWLAEGPIRTVWRA